MEHSGDNRESKGGFPWLATILVLPILYVESIGPAAGIYDSLPEWSRDFVEAFYSPLEWLHGESEIAEGVLNWYVALFDR